MVASVVLRPLLACACAAALTLPAHAANPQAPVYTVTKTVPLGAPDKWDYVVYDPGSHRVYVSHGPRLDVIDGRDGTMIGHVTGMPGGTHGIGVSAATGLGFTDDGKAGQAVAFDLNSLKVVKRLAAKPDADGVAFDEVSGHVFVVDGDSETVTVVDPKTDSVIANIALGGGLEYAVASGDGKLFVNGAEKRELVRIDTATNAVDARWPVPNCESPHGLAYDAQNHRAFISCLNTLMTVVNTDTGAVMAELPIGLGTDAAAFDPKRHLAFSANGEGSVSIIREVDPQTFVSLGSIPTPATGRTLAIDPESGRLFLAAADPDPNAPRSRPGRPAPRPGSLKLLFLDPAP
jgi:YVTN family beta-propeller protein